MRGWKVGEGSSSSEEEDDDEDEEDVSWSWSSSISSSSELSEEVSSSEDDDVSRICLSSKSSRSEEWMVFEQEVWVEDDDDDGVARGDSGMTRPSEFRMNWPMEALAFTSVLGCLDSCNRGSPGSLIPGTCSGASHDASR